MAFLSNFTLLLTGIGLGLLISAPVGPVNVLCIQGSLSKGFVAGLAIGFGALLADLMIAAMAALGITVISGFMKAYEVPVQIGGGVILLIFGLRLLLARPKLLYVEPGSQCLMAHIGALPQSFLLTITNPGAILGIFAVVGSAGSAVGGLASYREALFLLAGMFLGAAMWWLGLAGLVASFRRNITEQRLRLINQIAGGLLILSGAALFLKVGFW